MHFSFLGSKYGSKLFRILIESPTGSRNRKVRQKGVRGDLVRSTNFIIAKYEIKCLDTVVVKLLCENCMYVKNDEINGIYCFCERFV